MTPAAAPRRRQPCRQRRHLAPADPVEVLRSEIADIGRMLDRRWGTPPGAAEAGILCWFAGTRNVDTLAALHHDAALMLCDATAAAAVPPYAAEPRFHDRQDVFGRSSTDD